MPHLIGETELVDGHDLRRNDPKDRAGSALLAEEIDAISGYAGNLVRKIDVAGPHEFVPQPRRSHRAEHLREIILAGSLGLSSDRRTPADVPGTAPRQAPGRFNNLKRLPLVARQKRRITPEHA
jgi:hypothetical protein